MARPNQTVTLDEDVRKGLEQLAGGLPGSLSELVNQTLRDLLDYNRRFRTSVEKGLADSASGRGVETDELKRRLVERRHKSGA